MKKAIRTMEMNKNGKQISFEIASERGVMNMADKSEGFYVRLEAVEFDKVTVYVDGQLFAHGEIEDHRKYANIPGLGLRHGASGRIGGKMFLTEELLEALLKLQAEAIAEASTDAEYVELKTDELEMKNNAQVESAKRVVKLYESGKCLKSHKAATQYNNIHNEGGDGYVPEVITAEMCAAAKQKLINKN